MGLTYLTLKPLPQVFLLGVFATGHTQEVRLRVDAASGFWFFVSHFREVTFWKCPQWFNFVNTQTRWVVWLRNHPEKISSLPLVASTYFQHPAEYQVLLAARPPGRELGQMGSTSTLYTCSIESFWQHWTIEGPTSSQQDPTIRPIQSGCRAFACCFTWLLVESTTAGRERDLHFNMVIARHGGGHHVFMASWQMNIFSQWTTLFHRQGRIRL